MRPLPAAQSGDAKTTLGLAAALAAARRGLVPAPGPDLAAWWPATADALAKASESAIFFDAETPANLAAIARALTGWSAEIAGDPGRLGDAYLTMDAAESRRRSGRYYTPGRLCAVALEGVVEPGARVLDPACGGGRFLLAALDRLAPGPPSSARAAAVAESLAGVDRDPMAVAVCRAALLLAAAPSLESPLPLARRIVVADALESLAAARVNDRAPPPPLAAGAFDAVIGNPPYRAGRLSPLAADEARYRVAYEVAEYQLDPFPLFLELGLWASAPGGVLSMVVPNAWMSNLRMGRLRRLLLGQNGLEAIIELPPDAFGAGVETVVVRVRRGGRTAAAVPVYEVGGARCGTLVVEPGQPEGPLALARDGATVRLLAASASWRATLGDVAEVTRGINPYHHLTHTPEQIRDRVHHADHRRDETWRPELRGRDLGAYRLWWSGGHWIRYGPWLKEPRHPRFFDGPRLYVRKILGETLCAVHLDGPFLADQSVYIARLRPGQPWPPGALLAVVNSRLVATLLRARHQEDDVLFPQLKVGELRSLPLPPVEPDDPRVAALATRALALQALETEQLAALDAALGETPPGERSAARARRIRGGWPAGDTDAHDRAARVDALRDQIEAAVEALFAAALAG